MRSPRTVYSLLILFVAAACGGADGEGDRPDEAGALPAVEHPVVLSPVPGDVFRVAGGAPIRGGFLVFENRDPRLRYVGVPGRDGEVLEVAGEGPGEFREVTSVAVMSGDTVVVFDASLRRVSLFSSSGDFVRSVQLTGSDAPILGTLKPTAGGWLVAAGSRIRPGEGSGGSYRSTDRILRFDRDGEFVDVAMEVPGPEIFFGETGGFLRPLLARRSAWDVVGDSLIVSDGDGLEIRSVVGSTGVEPRLVELLGPSAPLPSQEHARVLDSLGVGISSSARARLRSTYEVTSLPDRMPVYGSVQSTGSGSVWIGGYADPRFENRPWVLFHASGGGEAKRVDLPRSIDLLWASEVEMLGVATDSLGVESIVHIGVGGER